MSGAIPLLPLYAFMAWTVKALHLLPYPSFIFKEKLLISRFIKAKLSVLNYYAINVKVGDAMDFCAFLRWVIEGTTEVQMLYQPEIIICLDSALSGCFLRNVDTRVI